MSEMSEIVVVQESELRLGTMRADGPMALIRQASNIATELAKIIDSRQLFTNIGGKKYVRVEGWSTLGAMLGVLPCEDNVTVYEDGTYEATVSLIRVNDGAVIGRGSAICGMDEKTWASRPNYARRSMAITRATGKAYRLGFSWIMTLAGYEATPAEEMDGVVVERPRATPRSKAKATNGNRSYSPEGIKAKLTPIVAAGSAAPATEKQRQLIAAKLNECFAEDPDADKKRYAVTHYLFGFESTKDPAMKQGHVDATLKWVLFDGKKDDTGDYPLHPNAPAEAAAIVHEALISQGQTEFDVATDELFDVMEAPNA